MKHTVEEAFFKKQNINPIETGNLILDTDAYQHIPSPVQCSLLNHTVDFFFSNTVAHFHIQSRRLLLLRGRMGKIRPILWKSCLRFHHRWTRMQVCQHWTFKLPYNVKTGALVVLLWCSCYIYNTQKPKAYANHFTNILKAAFCKKVLSFYVHILCFLFLAKMYWKKC